METTVFANQTVLVTGSSRGIGNAIARRLASCGADVAINYRGKGGSSEKAAEALREEIQAMGRRVEVITADISSKESVKELFAQVQSRFGRLDILVLNAARAPFKPIERLLERELRQLVETNYMGNIFCLQEALPLLARQGGKVVFISSLGSRFYNPSYPLGSMKAAMEAVVRDCAESLADRGIAVNGICAGLVKTDSFKVLRQYMEDVVQIPDALFVEPEEIADVTAFLCSPASRGIRGQTLVVDRGLSNRLYRPIPRA